MPPVIINQRIASQKSSTAIQRTVYVIQTLASKNLHPTEIDLKNIVLACSESPNSIASILGILSYPQKHENLIQAACTLNQLRLADLIFEHSLSDTSSNANPKILIRTLLSLRLFSRADLVYDRMVDSGRWSVQKGSQHMIHELLSKAQTFDLAFKYLIRLANVSDSVEVQLAAKIMKAMESENVASSNLFRASDLIYFLDCLSRKCTDIPPSLSDRISLMRNSIEDRSKQTLNILSGWSYIRGDTLTMKYVMAEHIKLSRISAGSTIHSNPRKLWNKIIFAESLCSNTQVINDNFQKMEELNIVLDSKSLSAKIHSQLNRKDYTSAILSYKHQLSTKIIPKASVFDRILAAEIVMMQNCPTVGAIINIIKTYRPIVTKEFKISEKTLLIVANVFTANLENLPQSTQFLSFLQTEFPETKFTAPIYNRIMFACINAYASEFVAEIEAHMSQTATLPDSNTFFLLLKSMCKRLSNAGTGIRTEHVWAIYAKMSKSGVALSKRHCELMMEITCIVGTHDEILQMWMMVIGAGFQMSETVIGSLLKILIKRTKPGTRKQLEKELGGNRSVDFRKICDTLIERNTILGTANSQLIFEWLKTDVCGN
ncbi:hypothetical protein HK100_000027 [Physocladia obscura]|uniref:Pentatricopeptide repeat-containing protein n=1 Tax=Physocladia obscura TaxID=109957 RepID=A0AAD5TCX2_9FUNG|nr:hypothetical protein HK100_000027 [Physocladia obscura]